jgi:hypothetical protein
MSWIKIGIIIIGALYVLILPYAVYKTIVRLGFDIRKYTLSYLSNSSLYDKKTVEGYTFLLLATAVLHYAFFWLLIRYYDLGEHRQILTWLDYSALFLTLLACIHHNMLPLSFKTLRKTLLRIGHNIFAVVVFLALPTLIIVFQSLIIDTHPVLGIVGFVIIGLTVLLTIASVIREKAINGIVEIIFILGISLWTIFITLATFFGG